MAYWLKELLGKGCQYILIATKASRSTCDCAVDFAKNNDKYAIDCETTLNTNTSDFKFDDGRGEEEQTTVNSKLSKAASGEKVLVPNVLNMSRENAEKELNENKLGYRIVTADIVDYNYPKA